MFFSFVFFNRFPKLKKISGLSLPSLKRNHEQPPNHESIIHFIKKTVEIPQINLDRTPPKKNLFDLLLHALIWNQIPNSTFFLKIIFLFETIRPPNENPLSLSLKKAIAPYQKYPLPLLIFGCFRFRLAVWGFKMELW